MTSEGDKTEKLLKRMASGGDETEKLFKRLEVREGCAQPRQYMYRMSIITILCPASLSSRLDVPRCTRMASIHNMTEALVGYIAPIDGVPKFEKNIKQAETMNYISSTVLDKINTML
jgi:hypothetical protein